jgi:signal transduction histidine kinase
MQARTGLDHESTGEVGRIAQALDQMAETLENKTDQLYSYQEQLRSMASELLLVEERARRGIATEMHDRIGQALAISKIRLGALIKAGENRQTVSELSGVKKYIDQAIAHGTHGKGTPLTY